MADKKEKRKEEIVDFGVALIHFWLEHPEKTLAWIVANLKWQKKF